LFRGNARALGKAEAFPSGLNWSLKGDKESASSSRDYIGVLGKGVEVSGIVSVPQENALGFSWGPKTGVFRERGEYIPESY